MEETLSDQTQKVEAEPEHTPEKSQAGLGDNTKELDMNDTKPDMDNESLESQVELSPTTVIQQSERKPIQVRQTKKSFTSQLNFTHQTTEKMRMQKVLNETKTSQRKVDKLLAGNIYKEYRDKMRDKFYSSTNRLNRTAKGKFLFETTKDTKEVEEAAPIADKKRSNGFKVVSLDSKFSKM